jgi:hypothetical protein
MCAVAPPTCTASPRPSRNVEDHGGIALDVRTAEENLQPARLTLARTRVALIQT